MLEGVWTWAILSLPYFCASGQELRKIILVFAQSLKSMYIKFYFHSKFQFLLEHRLGWFNCICITTCTSIMISTGSQSVNE